MSSIRPSTKKEKGNPSVRPSSISYGTRDRKILNFLKLNKNQRFSIRGYERNFKVPRSTIKDTLERFAREGLVTKEVLGNGYASYYINKNGEDYLDMTSGGVAVSRRECREEGNLSTHYLKYCAIVSNNPIISLERIKRLSPMDYKENKLRNLHQHILKYADATIIINPKKVIIRIHDILTEDTDESQVKSLNLALEYINLLKRGGIDTEGMFLEDGHFARVNSYLSDWLEKNIDDKYFLDLGDGKKFWIDHSNNKREDETNDINIRERLDNFLDDAINSESFVSDIDKMKEVVGMLVKLKVLENKVLSKPSEPINLNTRDTYFG